MKIKEIIVEPQSVFVGSTFKLKIKAIRYLTCKEMKKFTCKNVTFKCGEVRGL